MRVPLLALLLTSLAVAEPTLYVTADGMGKVTFPAPVPDRPGGFILFHDSSLFTFGLMTWAKAPALYYEGSRTLRLLERGVSVREVQAGPIVGQEFHSVSAEGRHNLLQEFAANGNVYQFSAYYSGAQPPAEVSRFFASISFSPEALDNRHRPRSRLIQCSVALDGLATALLDAAARQGGKFPARLPAQEPCPAGGTYVFQPQGFGFTIYCSGNHHQEAGTPPDYPRIDRSRQVLEGPAKPLPRPDLVVPPP